LGAQHRLRLLYGEQGNKPRYAVTKLTGEPQALYVGLYCQRAEAENRIAQVGLFAMCTSCHHFQMLTLAAVVARNTRRIRLYPASNWPSADIFIQAMSVLRSPRIPRQRLGRELTQYWPTLLEGLPWRPHLLCGVVSG
jgi:hypothetical protein